MVIERATIPDQAADDTIEDMHSKVMADLTLGGYAHDIVPAQTEFSSFIEADKPAGVIFVSTRFAIAQKLRFNAVSS